jgi:hypothetical protein
MRVIIVNRRQNETVACTARLLALSSQTVSLSEAIHNQGQAPGQQAAAKYRDGKRQIRGGSARACAVQQIMNAALHHEDR